MHRRLVPDYPAVLQLAQRSHRDHAPLGLTTLNAAVTREILRSGFFDDDPRDYYCLDGVPILKFFRKVLPTAVKRVTGADLVPYLCENLPDHLGPIVFVGETNRIALSSIATLAKTYSRSDLIYVAIKEDWLPSDPVGDAERDFHLSVKPAVVFVCLSFPKSRLWFEARRDSLPSGLYIGAGSALRLAGGHIARVPKAMRDGGFEWIGRFLQEPLRLGPRYVADMIFLVRLAVALSRPSNLRDSLAP